MEEWEKKEIKHPLCTGDGEWLPARAQRERGRRAGDQEGILRPDKRSLEEGGRGGGGRPHLPEGSRQAEQRLAVEAVDILPAWGDGKNGYEKLMYAKTKIRRVGWDGELH